MEKSIKGGYILISLGLSELSTFDDNLPYDRIIATKKHIVLTGLSLSGKKLPDVCVSPKFDDGDIIFENVYGYDITIESDNSVSVSEHESTEGTGLYIHVISTKDALDATATFTGITTRKNAYSSFTDFENDFDTHKVINPYILDGATLKSGTIVEHGAGWVYIYNKDFAECLLMTPSILSDTVTEL